MAEGLGNRVSTLPETELHVLGVWAWLDWQIRHSPMKNPVSRPIAVTLPPHGVAFVESVHSPQFRMAERVDGFHKIVYVLQGQVSFRAEAPQPVPVGAGSAICVSAGVRHQLADLEPPTLLLVCFDPGFLDRDPDLANLWTQLTRHGATGIRPGGAWGARFESRWRAGVVEQAGKQTGREVALRAAAANILVALARLPADAPSDPAARRVANVVREVAETFYEPWSLDRACARAGMSRRHFSKLFRAHTGRTFLDHLTDLRLDHAAQLLEEGRHSIIGAAFSSGYGDLSHFYRLFRTRFGLPPRTWLEKRHAPALPRRR